MRVESSRDGLIQLALEAMSVEHQSASINLTIAARELSAALTKMQRIEFPTEHTRS